MIDLAAWMIVGGLAVAVVSVVFFLAVEKKMDTTPEPDFTYLQRPHSEPELWWGGYRLYLQSEQWKERRERALERAYWRCEECRTKRLPLEVHHRTYERIGAEWEEDLEALCAECHDARHGG